MLNGKQVLITGGTGGLGLGVVPLALEQGAEVTLPYRRPDNLARLLQAQSGQVSRYSDRLHCVQANLLEEGSLERLINAMPRVDALIHLAGGFSMGATASYSYQAWQQDLDLNLSTTFLACKHCLRRMQSTGYGRIVTVASRGAVQPGAQMAAYCAAKAGVVALTQVIAAETTGSNITANVVLPSIFDTPTNRSFMGDAAAKDWVDPRSLAEVICFLASDAAQDLRGAAIPVYGNA